jgi:Flp pilus assembly protein TadG
MRSPSSQRGQALLEFALVLPILLLLMLGGAGLIMAYSARQDLHYVAQETAMCLAMNNPSCSGNAQGYAQTIAQQIGLANPTGVIASPGSSCGGACWQVTATYTVNPIFPFFPSVPLTTIAQFTKLPPSGGGPGPGGQ